MRQQWRRREKRQRQPKHRARKKTKTTTGKDTGPMVMTDGTITEGLKK